MANCKHFYKGPRVEKVEFGGKSIPKTVRNKKLKEFIAATVARKKGVIND